MELIDIRPQMNIISQTEQTKHQTILGKTQPNRQIPKQSNSRKVEQIENAQELENLLTSLILNRGSSHSATISPCQHGLWCIKSTLSTENEDGSDSESFVLNFSLSVHPLHHGLKQHRHTISLVGGQRFLSSLQLKWSIQA